MVVTGKVHYNLVGELVEDVLRSLIAEVHHTVEELEAHQLRLLNYYHLPRSMTSPRRHLECTPIIITFLTSLLILSSCFVVTVLVYILPSHIHPFSLLATSAQCSCDLFQLGRICIN